MKVSHLLFIAVVAGVALGFVLPGHDRGCAAASNATFWRDEALRAYAGAAP